MKLNHSLSLISLLFLSFTVGYAENSDKEEQTQQPLSYTDALILGAVEGTTEYLPISSTGHLILTNKILDLDKTTPIKDKDGSVIKNKDGEPITLKEAADSYSIVIQLGAILAVMILYGESLLSMIGGLLGRNPHGKLLLRNIILGFLPAAALGPILDDFIESILFGAGPVAIALAAGAIFIFYVERKRRAHEEENHEGPEMHELTVGQSLKIGLLQCIAMWPGTSRSLMTIAGGLLVGLNSKKAAEFSFLLGLITLSAAAGYKIVFNGSDMLKVLPAGPVLFGCFIAWITAVIAIKWLITYLTRHGLAFFAWYRLILAVIICFVFIF